MYQFKKAIGLVLIVMLSLLFGFTTKPVPSRTGLVNRHSTADEYYTMDDFALVKKFDVHIHINTEEPYFVDQAKKDNFDFLDIVDDRPFGITMDDQQKIALIDLHKYPERLYVATTFKTKAYDDKDYVKQTIADLKKSFAQGARAVKIWKNVGMDLRDKNGRFVMVDDPKIDSIVSFLEKSKIPVIGHNGEPKDCWMPLDKMTFSRGYYASHPEYHMYLHPEYPSYDDQINARDNMLQKHPHLKFIGAHLASLEWSLDELAKRFDKYPNLKVDLSRMSNLELHTLRDRDKTRNFFLKYQDRFVYGTDKAINATSNPESLQNSTHKSWLSDWKFFATDEKITLSGFGELNGLKLPKKVIDKIYYTNAKNWLQ